MFYKTVTKQLMLTTLIVFVVTFIVLPSEVYALSLRLPFPRPSEFVKDLLNQLLLSTIVLLTTSLIISALLAKSKKFKSGPKSNFPRLASKALLVIGALLFISRLSLQIGVIRDLIDRNYYASIITRYPGYYRVPTDIGIVTQEIIVGFKKGVSQQEAEEYLKSELKSEKAEFTKTDNVNLGKIFFYNTGLKYIVTVPFSDTDNLIAKFKSSPLVYDALKYSNDPNQLID